MGVGAGEKVLAAVLHPAHGALQPERQGGHHDLLREDMRLEAEAAPHLRRHHLEPVLGQTEAAGDQLPGQVRDLGRGPDPHPVARGRGRDAPVFERQRRLAGGPEGPLEDPRRAPQG